MAANVVTPEQFKAALGSWAAGVTVVTTKLDGMVYGLTVSSFSSLSMDPRLILVCLADSNRLPRMIETSEVFGVSVLAEGQDDISGWFSKSGREPLRAFPDEIRTVEAATGAPLIDGALAHIDCELEAALPGGDHTIMVGRVVSADAHGDRKPLIYYRRGYRGLVLD
ncbi:MAG: flavin reductase family protein [Dehalococcoidia bacterium]